LSCRLLILERRSFNWPSKACNKYDTAASAKFAYGSRRVGNVEFFLQGKAVVLPSSQKVQFSRSRDRLQAPSGVTKGQAQRI
jgi:hypothetical protein